MIANYHTHTYRCGHAEGSERDYVEAAVKAGMKTLGFSDHTPHPYNNLLRYRNVRMNISELPAYAETVRSLAAEYADRIEIFLGVEAEYYPKYFSRLVERLRENKVQYMILGQHFIGNEIGEPYCGRPTDDRGILDRYVSQSIEALQTGLFLYFAHPDLVPFTGDEQEYCRQMHRLCRTARDCGTPLEINLLGIREGRPYPTERFWRIAADEGNTVILGCDAHRPQDVRDLESEPAALALMERCGLTFTDPAAVRSRAGSGF